MIRTAVIVFTLITGLLFAFGCAENAPTDPAADPTPVPTSIVLDENVMLADFEGVTLSVTSGDASGYWYADNDAMDGGTSSVTGFGPSATPSAGERIFALKTNATINTYLPIGSEEDFSAAGMAPTNTGYVTNALMFSGPVSLTRNAGISWYHMSSGASGINQRVYIYDIQGRYIRTGAVGSYSTWNSALVDFESMYLPAGSTYTKEDVLKSVSAVIWVHRIFDTINSAYTAEFMIDGVMFETVVN